jgi:hypothetical protein
MIDRWKIFELFMLNIEFVEEEDQFEDGDKKNRTS